MASDDNNIHVLILSNPQEERTRYRKILTGISSLKNTMPVSSRLSYCEYKQGQGQNLGQQLEAADMILLLISVDFVGSPHYQKEVEIILQKQSQDKVRLIPILLSPIEWEETHLGGLQPLPNNRVPVSKWPSSDEAIHHISQHLRQTIQEILKEREYTKEQDVDTLEQEDTSVSFTAFNWTDSIVPLSYLTLSGKDSEEGLSRRTRLRMIMRIVYDHQKVSLSEPLSEQEIYERVQQKSNDAYNFPTYQNDLKYLLSNLNLVSMSDMISIATSIESFESINRKVLYEATSDGLAIEELIEKRMHSSHARLSKNDLSYIKEKLFLINEYMNRNIGIKPDDTEELEDQWKSIYETWERIVANSRDYLVTLTKNAQYEQYDIEKYMEYKTTVTRYVQSFASALLDIAHEINELFAGWSQQKERLIQVIADSAYRHDSALENKPSLDTFVEQIRSQMTNLEIWFKEKAPIFYERAASEIHRLINRAAQLALYQRAHMNTVTELKELAVQLLQETSFERAHQLFHAALAHVLPLHLSESLAGCAQMYEQAEATTSVWDEPAPAQLVLIPSKQRNGNTGVRRQEDPIDEQKQECYRLQAQEKQKEDERKKRFERLFAQSVISLDTLAMVDILDRTILEELIDRCLNHPACQYEDEVGNKIVLLNPHEQMYIHLHAHDGTLFLPRYQLKWQTMQDHTE